MKSKPPRAAPSPSTHLGTTVLSVWRSAATSRRPGGCCRTTPPHTPPSPHQHHHTHLPHSSNNNNTSSSNSNSSSSNGSSKRRSRSSRPRHRSLLHRPQPHQDWHPHRPPHQVHLPFSSTIPPTTTPAHLAHRSRRTARPARRSSHPPRCFRHRRAGRRLCPMPLWITTAIRTTTAWGSMSLSMGRCQRLYQASRLSRWVAMCVCRYRPSTGCRSRSSSSRRPSET
mmetsp:Transcript_14481/g.34567  ORF Transcript_14481/g.34567 Transcript_14481/m.34567 type:complete len:226 (-) Transcript_14481:465-1142(-)